MNRGESALSPRASRIWRIQKFSPCSKSTNVSPAPDVLANLVPRHHLAAAPGQQLQDLEGLRGKFDQVAVAAKFPGVRMELEGPETKDAHRDTHRKLIENSARING